MPKSEAIILDTDIGYDPDDIFALTLLFARAGHQLKLVVTADEVQGKRARLARKVLRLLGASQVRVVVGASLGAERFIADELIRDEPDAESGDFAQAVKELAGSSEHILYIGVGGFTNIARLIDASPDLKERVRICVMGGALDYSRGEGWIEHNVRIDIPSAKRVIESGWRQTMVMAQTTFNAGYEIGDGHPLLSELEASSHPVHGMIARHCRLWFAAKGYTTKMHDPLTVSASLGDSYVRFHEDRVRLVDGVLIRDERGARIRWSDVESEHVPFMQMMRTYLLAYSARDPSFCGKIS